MEYSDINFLRKIGRESWDATLNINIGNKDAANMMNVLENVGTFERHLPRSLYDGIESYDSLHKALIAGARDSGYKIVRDSGRKTNYDGSIKFSFACPKYLFHKNKSDGYMDDLYAEDIKKIRVHGKSSRGSNGKSKPRKSASERATCTSDQCKFRFSVKLLTSGSWVICKSGCIRHENHPRLSKEDMRVDRKLLGEEEMKLISSVRNGGGNATVTKGVLYENNDVNLTRGQIMYCHQKASECLEVANKSSSAEKLISYLKSRSDCSFTMLCTSSTSDIDVLSRPKGRPKKLKLVNVTNANEVVTENEATNLTESTVNDAVRLHNALKIESESKLMLCLFWICDEGHRKFNMYPEVLIADVTAQTNTEQRPLFLIVGRDSNNHSFTLGYVYMPSEKNGYSHGYLVQLYLLW